MTAGPAARDDGLRRFVLASVVLHVLLALALMDRGLGDSTLRPASTPVRVRVLAAVAPAASPRAVETPPVAPTKPPEPRPEPIVPPRPVARPKPPPEPVTPPPPEARKAALLPPVLPEEPKPELREPAPVAVEPPPPIEIETPPVAEAPPVEEPPAIEPIETAPEPTEVAPSAPSLELAAVAPELSLPPVGAAPAQPGLDELDPFEAYVELVRARIEERRRYPSMARRRRIEGDVRVRLEVDPSGRLEAVRALDAASRILVGPTLEAVERAGPFPAPPEGLGAIEVSVRYQLDD